MSQPNEPRFEDDFDCDTEPPEQPEFEHPSIEYIAITIPESDDPEAKRKAEQRVKARAVFAEKSDTILQAEMSHLLANPTLAKLESAKKISKELATRQKEIGKDAKADLVALRKQVKEEIDSIEDMELLADLLAQLRS